MKKYSNYSTALVTTLLVGIMYVPVVAMDKAAEEYPGFHRFQALKQQKAEPDLSKCTPQDAEEFNSFKQFQSTRKKDDPSGWGAQDLADFKGTLKYQSISAPAAPAPAANTAPAPASTESAPSAPSKVTRVLERVGQKGITLHGKRLL